ncbi:hypothetical protein GGR57DRAFT_472735 [Xylariaceae sp. FL1272]|nr:hypothetical protein GGR57DRAFT_472735 [Xylariaceae sp. FL1272]
MDSDSDDEYQPDSGNDAPKPRRRNSRASSQVRGRAPSRNLTIPRKRRRPLSFTERHDLPCLKRQKGNLNADYRALLNDDIRAFATGRTQDEAPENTELAPTQVGAVSWTAAEKASLFTALSCLGRGDIANIASRIGTKSELEVTQYLMLLSYADRQRRSDEGKRSRALKPSDIPAAVELSAECTVALEVAADALSLRQEAYEEDLERKRWDTRWLIHPALAQILELSFQNQSRLREPSEEPETPGHGQRQGVMGKSVENLPFLQLFPVRHWLRLSERIFMNSSVPDGNWRAVTDDNNPPAIRATAFEDFHALAVSVTKRLVLTTLFVAESRLRAKTLGNTGHHTRRLIRRYDVEAAAASLGMELNPRHFWAKCARRIRLDIVDDQDDDGMIADIDDEVTDITEDGLSEPEQPASSIEADLDGAEEPSESPAYDVMSYNDVEAALGIVKNNGPEVNLDDLPSVSSSETEETDIEMEDPDSPTTGLKPSISSDDEEREETGLDSEAIIQDFKEATVYSASLEFVGTARAKEALRSRIRAEHALEQEAEQQDIQASVEAENNLWSMLHPGRTDSNRSSDVNNFNFKGGYGPGRAHRTRSKSLRPEDDGYKGSELDVTDDEDEDEVEPRPRKGGIVDVEPEWRDNFKYHSEWEMSLRS